MTRLSAPTETLTSNPEATLLFESTNEAVRAMFSVTVNATAATLLELTFKMIPWYGYLSVGS